MSHFKTNLIGGVLLCVDCENVSRVSCAECENAPNILALLPSIKV
jgi:hypothetical protein